MTLCLLNWDERHGPLHSSNLPESEHALNSDKVLQYQVKLHRQSNEKYTELCGLEGAKSILTLRRCKLSVEPQSRVLSFC